MMCFLIPLTQPLAADHRGCCPPVLATRKGILVVSLKNAPFESASYRSHLEGIPALTWRELVGEGPEVSSSP